MKRSVAFTAVLVFQCAHSEPFATTDQNPLLIGVGLPEPLTARIPPASTTSLSGTLNWSSTAAIQQSANEHLVIDAESREWRIAIEHAFTDRFSMRLELPYRTINGGTLDSFVEHWHSFFGLPQGDRPALPRNDYRIEYQRASATALHFTKGSSGIGDISLAGGYQLSATAQSATSVWASIKFPTGNGTPISSGAYDGSVGLAHEHSISSRWTAFAQANVIYVGTGDLLPSLQRSVVYAGLAGVDYRYSNALSLMIQLDGHTAAFENTSLDLLGNAWIMTFGGAYRFANHWRAQFGVSEDVKVEASPDVNLVITVVKSWK